MIFGKNKKNKEQKKRTPWVDDLVDEVSEETSETVPPGSGESVAEGPSEEADAQASSENFAEFETLEPSSGDYSTGEPDSEQAEQQEQNTFFRQPDESDLYEKEESDEGTVEAEEEEDNAIPEDSSDEAEEALKEENEKEAADEKKDSRKKKSFFTRFSIFLLVVSLLMVLIFYLMHRIPSMIIAVIQIVGIILALLFHNKKLHSGSRIINRITVLLLVILIMAGNIFLNARNVLHSRSVASRNAQLEESSLTENASVSMPLSSADCVGQSYSDIYKELKDAGFTNVDARAVEDLSYDDADQAGLVSSVVINGETSFQKNQVYDSSSSIIIYYHDLKACSLDLQIVFNGNILFNKYDLDVYINDTLKGTLEHGEDGEYLIQEKPGTVEIRIEKSGDSDISVSYEVDLTSDTVLTLTVSCSKDAVSIDSAELETEDESTDTSDSEGIPDEDENENQDEEKDVSVSSQSEDETEEEEQNSSNNKIQTTGGTTI